VIFGRVQEQVVTHLLQVCNSSHILFLGLGMFVFCQNDYAFLAIASFCMMKSD
jgi:hypothetical protein